MDGIKQKRNGVVTIDCDPEQKFLLTADHHWDNPQCDRQLLIEDLNYAVENQMGIFVIGDLFCAMQGKYDPRASKSKLRSEHQVDNYLDALVETAVEFYSPYVENLILISRGNHETSINRRRETDLIKRLVHGLNQYEGSNVKEGKYAGEVIFNQIITMAYHHGIGAGGPVTRGVIDSNRLAVMFPNADIMITGHSHDAWHVPIKKLDVDKRSGNRIPFIQHHIRIPSYKDEFSYDGWWVESGKSARPLGSVVMGLNPLSFNFRLK